MSANPTPAVAPLGPREKLIEAIIGRYEKYVRCIVERGLTTELRRREGATEVMQEVWVRAARGAPRVRAASVTDLRPWIGRVASNAVKDVYRRAKNSVTYRAGELSAEPAPKSAPRQESRLTVEMAAALERLSDQHRQVLFAREVEGLTLEAIAEAKGVSVQKARSLVADARRRLTELMGEAGR